MVDTLISNGEVVTAVGHSHRDIAITNGIIDQVGQDLTHLEADELIDASDRIITPGVVDAHTHVEYPDWEFETGASKGSQAAVAGGVTSVINFLNAQPGETMEDFNDFRSAFEEESLIDFSFHVNIFSRDQIDLVPELVEMGVNSFKILLPYKGEEAGAYIGIDDGIVYKLMQKVSETDGGARVLVHPENVEPSFKLKTDFREQYGEDHDDAATWAEVRPDFLEADAINRMMLFADETDCPTHFVHMSSEKGLWHYRKNRGDVPVTAEAQVQHLITDANDHGLLAKMNPPIRTPDEHDALWQGVRNGDIRFFSSDHAPCATKHKQNLWDATVGLPNLQTWFPLVLTKVLDDRLIDLPKLVEMCSTAPAKFYRLTPRKGGIWPGADADLNIIDPQNRIEVSAENMHDQSDFTIYEGQELVFPELTLVSGDIVCEDGEIVTEPGNAEFLSRPIQ